MKLSEAIRLGSMLGPQIFNAMVAVNSAHNSTLTVNPFVGTCAQGAALAAVGATDITSYSTVTAEKYWPWLFKNPSSGPVSSCPICLNANHPFKIWSIIIHLNDYHRWTRERIADWIETIEPAGAPEANPEIISSVEEPVVSEITGVVK